MTGRVEKNIRIIARLDIKGPNLVKGIHLEGLRVLGKPEWFARHYYEQGADELVYMDAVASLYERNSLLPMVQRTSREIFIPLTLGGGLRSVDDIRTALRSGADKVALNTAAVQRPELIREASQRFGSSTITISIEAKRLPGGRYEVFTDNGRMRTGVDVFEWAVRVAELGAGEILLTSIDQEGTGRGFDLDLVRTVAQSVPIPVIACGGAGSANDVVDAVSQGAADAVCVASIVHYDCLQRIARDDDYSMEGNIEFLRSAQSFGRVTPTGIPALKAALATAKIPCRPLPGLSDA